jgi:tetratricopeptide (TPR) repeat protein
MLAVLSAAAQNDWSGVDRSTAKVDQGESQGQEHGNRAVARAANEEGKAALQAGNYPASVDAFRRGVAADPVDIELLNNLAYALEEAGQQQEAVNTISSVLVRAPRRTAAWANLSSSLAKSGQIDQAIAALGIAVHYSTNRDRTLAFLQQQAASGNTEAERHVSAAVLQQAETIPAASAPTVAEVQPVAQRPHPTMRAAANRQPSSGDEAYVRSMNQQLEQQLKELGQSK